MFNQEFVLHTESLDNLFHFSKLEVCFSHALNNSKVNSTFLTKQYRSPFQTAKRNFFVKVRSFCCQLLCFA